MPLAQVYALLACYSFGKGMEPDGPTYEEADMWEEVARLQAARALT